MGVLYLIGLTAGFAATGLAMLTWFSGATLSGMARAERFAIGFLAGMLIQTLVALMMAFVGFALAGWWWAVMGLISLVVVVLRYGSLPRIVAADPISVHTGKALWGLIAFGGVALAVWALWGTFTLPTMEYDGLVIWSYRDKVLLAERVIHTPSLRDPLRLVAQPLHPYLLPVLETSFLIAWGSFSYVITRMPHAMVYFCYLMAAWSVSRSQHSVVRGLMMAAALVLLPAMATAPVDLSTREPFMAVMAMVSTWMLVRWAQDSRPEFLLMSLFFAFAMQQTKIEGLPFAVGTILGALVIAVGSGPERGRRLVELAYCSTLFALAVPWLLVKRGIPPAHVDPFQVNYSNVLGVTPENLMTACRVMGAEFLFRPELYGLLPVLVLWGLVTGWRRGERLARIGVLLGPLVLLAAILAIYAVRQGELPSDRNASITRRMICVLPALTVAALALPRRRKVDTEAVSP
ncbi:MAG: hypothetical protein K1X53_05055 [Candidatus Sumerlaeaceae bacterium]|nr:hypothetical protein [Candidatus Sumerlaeaceae bacterium]